jgi:hypothetical protein
MALNVAQTTVGWTSIEVLSRWLWVRSGSLLRRSLEGQGGCRCPMRGKRVQMREFRVWQAAGERPKPRSVRVTRQQPPQSVSDGQSARSALATASHSALHSSLAVTRRGCAFPRSPRTRVIGLLPVEEATRSHSRASDVQPSRDWTRRRVRRSRSGDSIYAYAALLPL